MRCWISKEKFCSLLFPIPLLSMLAQFQERYPTASLLSELLTIYQGKFVVQVLVQIEGVTRATGMAAAETVELAEDQARLRAIALIATQEMIPSIPQRDIVTSTPELINPSIDPDSKAAPTDNYSEFALDLRDYSLKTTNSDLVDEDFGIEPITPINSNPVPTFSNVTPFVVRTPTEEAPQLLDFISPESQLSVPEPIDLSDTLIAIETELRNLRWTGEQERKYLKRIYNKESRDLLGTQQLFEFLNYLQVFTQTSKELERLGWTNQQGKEYLAQNYNKQSRQYLSYQELKEFLQHLQANS